METPRGYVSTAAKTAFVKRAVFSVGVGAFVQIAIPIIAMFMTIHTVMGQNLTSRSIDPSRGAFWKGAVWLVADPGVALNPDDPAHTQLLKWVPDSENPPDEAKLPPVLDPQLLATDETLWIVGSDVVAAMSAEGTVPVRVDRKWGYTSEVFLLEDRPSMFEIDGDRLELHAFTDGAWKTTEVKDLPAGSGDNLNFYKLDILDTPSGPLVFARGKEGIHYREGLSGFATQPIETLPFAVKMGKYATVWTATVLDGKPVLITLSEDIFKQKIEGFRKEGESFEKFFEITAGIVSRMGAYSTDDPGRLLIATEGMPGSITIFDVRDGEVVEKTRLSQSGLIPAQTGTGSSLLSNAVGVIMALIVGLMISSWMRRYKLAELRTEHGDLVLASLARRGAATMVDSLIILGPVVAGWFLFVESNPFDVEEHGISGLVDMFKFFGAASVWMIVWIALFSIMESRSGMTPGKRLARIRVLHVDLNPCGLGRALLRNMLKYLVDSMFDFLLGILLIALTEKRQRLGDLAAGTVVVHEATPRD